MQDDIKKNEIEQKNDAENKSGMSRRRFTQASMVTPVIMSLASRPVLGQGNQCVTSGLESGNHSGVTEISCQGCNTTEWKNNTSQWGTTYTPGTLFNVDTNGDGVFSGTAYGILTLLQVLQLPLADDPNNVGKETVAALLNAAKYGPTSSSQTIGYTFGYTTDQIISIYNGWATGGGTNAELVTKFQDLHGGGGKYTWISCPFGS